MDKKIYAEDIEDISTDVLLLIDVLNHFYSAFSDLWDSDNDEYSRTMHNLLYVINWYAGHVAAEIRAMLEKQCKQHLSPTT